MEIIIAVRSSWLVAEKSPSIISLASKDLLHSHKAIFRSPYSGNNIVPCQICWDSIAPLLPIINQRRLPWRNNQSDILRSLVSCNPPFRNILTFVSGSSILILGDALDEKAKEDIYNADHIDVNQIVTFAAR